MDVNYQELSDVTRYIECHGSENFEDQLPVIKNIFETIKSVKPIDANSRLLEIGIGRGWLQVYGKQEGYNIQGLEITSQLIEVAKQNGRKYGVDLDLVLGNIEERDIGDGVYDVVIASSVFEHVEDWQTGVQRIFAALKPGGLFYFDSTNKFSFKSGEYNFPLYGWMPNNWRYRLRRARQGDDIMRLGIDFHQFTYPQLRNFFKQVGFSSVLDLVDFKDPARVQTPTPVKRIVLDSVKKSPLLKHVLLTFVPATIFVCTK